MGTDSEHIQAAGNSTNEDLGTRGGGPPPYGDPSDNRDDDNKEEEGRNGKEGSVEAGEEPESVVDAIREELLQDFTLVPYWYRPQQWVADMSHLNPRVKRQRYEITQRRWLKDRGGGGDKNVIEVKDLLPDSSLPQGTAQYWTGLFGIPSPPFPNEITSGDINILGPVSLEEVQWLKKTMDKSSASELTYPDPGRGVAASLPPGFGSWVFQREMASGTHNAHAKEGHPQNPPDFRPITMTSCLTWGLHKILARQLVEVVQVDNVQRRFKAEGRVVANLSLIKNIIQPAKVNNTPLYIGFIDFK